MEGLSDRREMEECVVFIFVDNIDAIYVSKIYLCYVIGISSNEQTIRKS